MAYQSLYRKYRPQTFSDVMGQGHVTRTLQNALASGRVGHGYLFTGTRGTAKTTVARLLAKALNCLSSDKPTPEPCNKCTACASITNGSCIDVIEMDAASHRGVADMEEVRKAVGYGPMEMRFKVFIIDEAHQLSSDAKDAFLKTLEEPPDNVVFILATTEPQAIPITIRSRCQQFDFKRGTLQDIAARLRYVLDCEAVSYTPDAINLIARGAEGSWRDALSLLEQVLAFAPEHISGTDVDAVLGTLDSEMLARVTEAVAQKDAPNAFALAGQLLDAGKEARTLLRTLSAHFRDLLIVSVGGPAVGMEFTPEEVAHLQAEARAFTPAQMMRAMDVLNEAQGETRWNNQHRLLVELAFLKLMTLGDALPAGKGASASPLPQTVFATAPIVFAAPSTPPVAPTPNPSLVGTKEGSPSNESGVSNKSFAGSGDSGLNELPSFVPTREGLGVGATGGVGELNEAPDTLPAFFASDDEADDEDDYVPPHTDEDADPVEVMLAEAVSAPRVVAAAIADDDEAETDETELEPVDDGPSLFDDFPNATPAFTPATAAPVTASIAAPIAAPPLPVRVEAPPRIVAAQADPDEVSDALPEASDMEDENEAQSEPTLPAVLAAPPIPLPVARVEPDEPEAPAVTLDDVMRAWPDFLRKAGMVSKKTEMMMVTARPVSADRSGIEIAFGSRATFDMMNTPVAQGFVRNVLTRSLGVSHVAVRFILDESAAPAPAKRNAAKEKKTVRDPLAELDALEKGEKGSGDGFGSGQTYNNGSGGGDAWNRPVRDGNGYHHVPAPTSYGFSSGGTDGATTAPPPTRREPIQTAPTATFGTAQNAPRRMSAGEDFAPAPFHGAVPVNGSANSGGKSAETSARNAHLMENPLVQDVLSIFGGEITDD